MARTIVHVEIPAADRQAMADFYKNVFGWNLNHNSTFDYLQFIGSDGQTGAFVPNSGEFWAGTSPNSPIVYFGSDDVNADIVKIEAAGGQILAAPLEIPGVGWMGLFRDPNGNHMGLFQYTNQES